MNVRLDDKDHRIVQELRQNARLSIRDIARLSGIKPSTVHQRIQKLTDKGIIEKYTVKVNNDAIGEGTTVFILGTIERVGLDGLRENSKIKEIFRVSGEHDLMLKAKFSSVSEFNDFYITFKKEYKPSNAVSFFATEVLKEEL